MGPCDTDVLASAPAATLVAGLGPVMHRLQDMVHEIARTDIPVLLVGESGTGKDAFARRIHQLSRRNGFPFQKCNCTSIDLPDRFRQSKVSSLGEDPSGTLYLDNLQELDSTAQRMLLSIFPDGEDANSNTFPSGRIISSTTSSLELEIELGRFRRELYFRLNGACLRIPPLRERAEDIPSLAEHFLSKQSIVLKKLPPPLEESAVQALVGYHWPGNIRELENLVRTAVLFGNFQIALNELQLTATEARGPLGGTQGSSLKLAARAASRKAERDLILQALERTHWNRKRAAQELQISYKSLLSKIKQAGLEKHASGSL